MQKTKMYRRTSENYIGTTTDYLNDPHVKGLKAAIRGKGYRLCVKGRKPKVEMIVKDYWTGLNYYSGYDGCGNVVGGLKNAQVFDIYIYKK